MPATVAARARAIFFRSSHGYIAKVQAAMCAFLHRSVRERLAAKSERAFAHRIVCLAVDETEFHLKAKGDRGKHSVMMLHGRVFTRTTDGIPEIEEVPLPPALLLDITAPTLYAAIKDRAFHWTLKSDGVPLSCSIFTSDSASSLLNVAEHMALKCDPNHLFIHGRCLMHRLWGAFSATVSRLDVVNPMYNATCIMHRSGTMQKVRGAVQRVVRAKLRVTVEPGQPKHIARNKAIIAMVNAAEPEAQRFLSATCGVGENAPHSLPPSAIVLSLLDRACTVALKSVVGCRRTAGIPFGNDIVCCREFE
jgi:hypothetical protein